MTSFRRSKILTTRIEYVVKSGAYMADFLKVMNMAWVEYCQLSGAEPGHMYDDWATVTSSDDEVVIIFSVDKEMRETQ